MLVPSTTSFFATIHLSGPRNRSNFRQTPLNAQHKWSANSIKQVFNEISKKMATRENALRARLRTFTTQDVQLLLNLYDSKGKTRVTANKIVHSTQQKLFGVRFKGAGRRWRPTVAEINRRRKQHSSQFFFHFLSLVSFPFYFSWQQPDRSGGLEEEEADRASQEITCNL